MQLHGRPPFSLWLHNKVQEKLQNMEDVDEELVNLSTEPCTRTLSYRSMWAFGNHYRMEKGNMLH
jgi:hypothetical protein